MNSNTRKLSTHALPNVRLARYLLGAALFTLILLVSVPFTYANATGNAVYVAGSGETTGYARVIQLQHSATKNGYMLATFERWYSSGGTVPLIIRQSVDSGKTWSNLATVNDPTGTNLAMYQPFLFEFPVTLGSYPAGTLLLVANSIESGPTENFFAWRSTDDGVSWTAVNGTTPFMTGYSGGSVQQGVWEPFLYVDSHGRLVCVFSDQRQEPTHDQVIGQIISTDGGVSWGPESNIVVGPLSGDTPGMPTVAKMGNGSYILATEACGPSYGCSIHTTISTDGTTWPGTVGSVASTADGRTLYGSPYIVYSPNGVTSAGSLLLSADAEFYTPSSLTIDPFTSGAPRAPENNQVIFVNNYNGTGSWSWMGGPYLAAAENTTRDNAGYSPALLLSPDGKSLTEMCTTTSSLSDDEVTTGTITPALAPASYSYTDPFAATPGTDAGWVDYGGSWSVTGGTYHDSSTGPNKAMAGPTYWVNSPTLSSNYTLAGDVMLSVNGTQAGFLVRASNPSTGIDTVNGYYIGIENTTGTVFIGRENGSWTGLTGAALPGGVQTNTWYHITITVNGDTISVSAQPSAGGSPGTFTVTDSTFPWGGIGIRDFNALAYWRNITVN